jgi:hypothetical protein
LPKSNKAYRPAGGRYAYGGGARSWLRSGTRSFETCLIDLGLLSPLALAPLNERTRADSEASSLNGPANESPKTCSVGAGPLGLWASARSARLISGRGSRSPFDQRGRDWPRGLEAPLGEWAPEGVCRGGVEVEGEGAAPRFRMCGGT